MMISKNDYVCTEFIEEVSFCDTLRPLICLKYLNQAYDEFSYEVLRLIRCFALKTNIKLFG